MAIDPSAAVRNAPPTPAVNPKSQMGNEAFLKLLVAELRQQDPTEPMDAREMITQLSQMSSVEKLTTIDKSLEQLKAQNAGLASSQVASLVGRTVTADASTLTRTALGVSAGNYDLQGQAASVSVTVRDADGNLVRTLDQGKQQPGAHAVAWDGKDDAGAMVPNGTYSYQVTAKDQRGQPVTSTTQVEGVVREVSYDAGATMLVVGDARVSLGDVISVAQ